MFHVEQTRARPGSEATLYREWFETERYARIVVEPAASFAGADGRKPGFAAIKPGAEFRISTEPLTTSALTCRTPCQMRHRTDNIRHPVYLEAEELSPNGDHVQFLSGGGKFGELNVTPMIDVLLVLLVIFMIITPLTPKGEAAQIPQPPLKHAPQQRNNQSVVLQVVANGNGQPKLEINQQAVSWQDLDNRLVGIYEIRAEKVLFIKAGDNVPWQDVATLIDDAHTAGVDHVGLLTAKIEASG